MAVLSLIWKNILPGKHGILKELMTSQKVSRIQYFFSIFYKNQRRIRLMEILAFFGVIALMRGASIFLDFVLAQYWHYKEKPYT